MTTEMLKKPTTNDAVVVGPAKVEQAAEIAEMLEAALGKGGVFAPGHEQYPDPDMFTAEGVKTIITTPDRQMLVGEVNGKPMGSIIIDWLNPYQCEFNCLAVRLDQRKLKIGSAIIAEAKKVVDAKPLVVNTTEIVTHSLASQSGYLREGYDKMVGLSFCHYPNVFFKDHPESVLWVSRLQGYLYDVLCALRWQLGSGLSHKQLLEKQQQIVADLKGADAGTVNLALAALAKRAIYLPQDYREIAADILSQFSMLLDYEIAQLHSPVEPTVASNPEFEVAWRGEYRYCHIIFPDNFNVALRKEEVADKLSEMRARGKKFIFARIAINEPSAIQTAEYLRSQGFAFHSILPLYSMTESAQGPIFSDMLGMQWIDPEVLKTNELPGDTNSVVKIYGYPANMSGPIVQSIRDDLSRGGQ